MKIFLITVLFFHSHLNSQDSGYQMYKDGDINSALQYYNTLLEMENEDISKESLLYNIGTIYSSMNSIPEANSVFQKAYNDSLENFSSDLSYNYGNALYRSKNLEKSLNAYRDALLRNPNDSDARKNYEFVKNEIKKNKNMIKQQDQKQDSKQDQDNKEDKKDQNSNQNENQNQNQNDNKKNNSNNDENPNQDESPQVDNNESNQNQEIQSNQSAENILNALKENEKVNKKRKQKKSSQESVKDW